MDYSTFTSEAERLNRLSTDLLNLPDSAERDQKIADFNATCRNHNAQIAREQELLNDKIRDCNRDLYRNHSVGSDSYNRILAERTTYENSHRELENAKVEPIRYRLRDFITQTPSTPSPSNSPAPNSNGSTAAQTAPPTQPSQATQSTEWSHTISDSASNSRITLSGLKDESTSSVKEFLDPRKSNELDKTVFQAEFALDTNATKGDTATITVGNMSA